jgi:L,D-peptidoglycan transpeptidase YkuD (ErfK/YbiS/YcfS/YnhG family)
MLRFANMIYLFSYVIGVTLHAHDQLLLVVADDMNRSSALLQRYERTQGGWETVGERVPVNVGRNGLGWGIGIMDLPHPDTDPVKHEGDGRAPAGVFALGPVFGYAASISTRMPYLQATPDLVCVDDSLSAAYNRIVPVRPELSIGSFEWMRREDSLYRIGVVVGHNGSGVAGRGSCIFLHIEKAPGAGTAGCTSMAPDPLATIIRWLDPEKSPLLVQIPRQRLPEAQKRFEGIGEYQSMPER